ncbi:MAG: ABC transporter permease subunit [Pseudohongiellaceae bacterium]
MKRFLLALKIEIFIGLRNSSSKLLLLAPTLFSLLQLLIVKLSQTGQESRDSLLGRDSFAGATTENAYGYFVDGMLTGLVVLSLLLTAIAAYSFSNDKEVGSVRHLVIRGLSRRTIVLAKLVYLHALSIAALATLFASCYLLSASLWEFGPIIEDGFELISEAEIWSEIELGLGLALLPMPAAIGFALLVSVIAQSATQAVSVALGLTLLIDVFKSSLGKFAYLHYANFQPSILDQSYLQDVSRLVRGYSDVLVDQQFFDYNLWTPLPSLAVFLLLTLIVVQRIKL